MKIVKSKIDEKSLRAYVFVRSLLANKRGAIGKDEILGVAVALIISAFVIIPQLRTFAGTVMTALNNWWSGTIATKIFPTS